MRNMQAEIGDFVQLLFFICFYSHCVRIAATFPLVVLNAGSKQQAAVSETSPRWASDKFIGALRILLKMKKRNGYMVLPTILSWATEEKWLKSVLFFRRGE